MDEVTHEMVWKGHVIFGFNINTGHIRFTSGKWGTEAHSAEGLARSGWELRPVHVELENK